MHNAVYPLSQEYRDIPRPEHSKEKVVTFLGRITMQKGPEYFVEAAALVLKRTEHPFRDGRFGRHDGCHD